VLYAVRLRPANIADIALLRSWDTKPHVMAATGEDSFFDWEKEITRNVNWRELLIAECDGRPIGMLQIIDPEREEDHYWGEVETGLRAIDIWIGEESDLGRRYGTQMMRLALARCFADTTVKAVLLDPLASNTRARRFYERLGFRFVAERRFGNDLCSVYRIDRKTWRLAKG
jgi:aminoglycoside 6'-N-acetyltransferase